MPEPGSPIQLPITSVLVADPSLMGRQLAAFLFQQRACAVETFSSILELIVRFSSSPADLVLVDDFLSDPQAPPVPRCLGEIHKGRPVYCVALTLDPDADSERCLAAGYNEVILTPLEPASVDAVLARLRTQAIDLDETLRRLGGNRELLAKLVGVLSQSIATWSSELDAAFAAGDAERVRRTAHQVKGALSNFAATRAVAGAKRLEDLAKGGDLVTARAARMKLWAEIGRVQSELIQITQ